MSASEWAAAEAGEALRARERAWVERLERCQCSLPVRDRLYLGHWQCRVCGALIRRVRAR